MSKPLLGLVLGTALGLLDGLSAYFAPEAAPMMLQIVVGSTLKGLLTGVLAGIFARRMRSMPLGIVFALAIGLVLSFFAAQAPDPQGNHHYLEIMLPGGLLGAIVGFATQRYGRGMAGVALLLCLSSAPAFAGGAAAPDNPWAPVQFMVGQWDGDSEGQPGKGTVKRTYRFVLGDRFLHEQNVSTYPPQPKNEKGEVHEHWSFLSYDKGRRTLVLRQFHQEGFVNQFAMAPVALGKPLVFESEALENVPAAWKARETYEILSADEFVETFELALGDKPYEVYSRTRFKRSAPKPYLP